jgi:4'-phosphopantetheinyl transferase
MFYNSLDLYAIDLSSYLDEENFLIELLDESEKKRAYGFKFDHIRRRFIVSHALLRSLLSQYIQIKPQEIIFYYNAYGKPYLKNNAIRFNMSHSHNMALFVFSPTMEVGIDIEYINPIASINELPISYFSQTEQEEIKMLSGECQTRAFYKHWTRMEAYLKAVGIGLYNFLPPLRIDQTEWNHYEVSLPKDYVGSLVYPNMSAPITIFQKLLNPFSSSFS